MNKSDADKAESTHHGWYSTWQNKTGNNFRNGVITYISLYKVITERIPQVQLTQARGGGVFFGRKEVKNGPAGLGRQAQAKFTINYCAVKVAQEKVRIPYAEGLQQTT